MLKQHDYEYLYIYCKCTCNETRSDERVKCLSNLHLFQRVLSTCIYNVYINTLYMTGIIHPHSVCVVSMLDPAMFGCATLVSAPVKEGPRNVSFVHLQPPAHRESIGILLVYLSVAYYSCKRNQNEEQCDFRSSTICLCVYLRANNPDFLHR